jgi:hypothetical protein
MIGGLIVTGSAATGVIRFAVVAAVGADCCGVWAGLGCDVGAVAQAQIDRASTAAERNFMRAARAKEKPPGVARGLENGANRDYGRIS